jgi:hypothetical protein
MDEIRHLKSIVDVSNGLRMVPEYRMKSGQEKLPLTDPRYDHRGNNRKKSGPMIGRIRRLPCERIAMSTSVHILILDFRSKITK